MKVRGLKDRTQWAFSFSPWSRDGTADEVITETYCCNDGKNNRKRRALKGMLACCIIFLPYLCNESTKHILSLFGKPVMYEELTTMFRVR